VGEVDDGAGPCLTVREARVKNRNLAGSLLTDIRITEHSSTQKEDVSRDAGALKLPRSIHRDEQAAWQTARRGALPASPFIVFERRKR
jgi:hypothetical protein